MNIWYLIIVQWIMVIVGTALWELALRRQLRR